MKTNAHEEATEQIATAGTAHSLVLVAQGRCSTQRQRSLKPRLASE